MEEIAEHKQKRDYLQPFTETSTLKAPLLSGLHLEECMNVLGYQLLNYAETYHYPGESGTIDLVFARGTQNRELKPPRQEIRHKHFPEQIKLTMGHAWDKVDPQKLNKVMIGSRVDLNNSRKCENITYMKRPSNKNNPKFTENRGSIMGAKR